MSSCKNSGLECMRSTMSKIEYLKIKKLFIRGSFAALLTIFLGEIPLGWVVNPEADTEILSVILGYASLSLLQLACGLFFGAVGIPLQYYGYKAIIEIMATSNYKKCTLLTDIGAKAIAFGGATVHVICVALMYICKIEYPFITSQIPQSIVDFAMWLVLPFSIVFMSIYTLMTISMAIPIIRGKTIFPKWAVIFNPLVAKILIPAISMVLPNTKLVNGLNMADMGIGSLLTFIGLLVLLEKQQKDMIENKKEE